LGNVTTDAIRKAAGSNIAFLPAGSFKEIVVSVNNIASLNTVSLLQYPDDLITIRTLTGSQILKALERSVSLIPQKNKGFLQVSGMSFKYNPKAAKGSRVTSVTINGKPLVQNKSYSAAMTQPFSNGGYGYFIIWGKSKDNVKETGKTISDAVKSFVTNINPSDYKDMNRIIAQ
jgi:hypothetical protein